MAKSFRIPVKPEVLHWALEESKKNEAEFLSRFPKAGEWLKYDLHPTFKQLEKVAKFLHIPFGYLFLDSPPKMDVMEVEFRSISNKMPQISKNLQDTILDMDHKKSWMSDYRRDIGWGKLEVIENFNERRTANIIADAKLAKQLLGLTENWYTRIRDLNEAFRFLRNNLEQVGILVMRNGIVGSNTHRSLDINEFRAFMLYDELAPLIFINNNDSQAGKVFSLIHEYFHVLFEQDDVMLDPYVGNTPRERQINALTAEFLMPQERLLTLWNNNLDILKQIGSLSEFFKVSKLALAIKLNNMGLIDWKVVEGVRKESLRDFGMKVGDGGGNFYITYRSRVSTVFVETVIRSAESGEIGHTDAFRLLGVKGKTYDNIKAGLMPYG